MDNVIFLRAFQTRLPRRLINDGWWLEERHPAATGRRTGAFPRPEPLGSPRLAIPFPEKEPA